MSIPKHQRSPSRLDAQHLAKKISLEITTELARTFGYSKARFKVSFGGNIAVPTGGTAGAISVALAIAGEPLNSATAIVTPAAAGNYFNVFAAAFIEVPRGCCVTVAVENTSTQAIDIANSNLIVERVA